MAIWPLCRTTMLLASRKGLMQLVYLLTQVGRLPVDTVLDDVSNTTALHQAASHGQVSCVELLISVGSDPLRRDAYGHTALLLSAMFGHQNTCNLLAQHHEQDLPCRAGTTAKNVRQNFDDYLQKYNKMCDHVPLTPIDHHDHDHVMSKLIKSIRLNELQMEAQRVTVDFSNGEAKKVREVIMAELNTIMEKVSAADPTYRGTLRLVGSSQDGSKLYAPDEYDVNIVIKKDDDVDVKVTERKNKSPLESELEILVDVGQPQLEGNNLMHNLYEEVQLCLADHRVNDVRLSIVPPGVTSTLVGVAFALAWQGKDYPLLLIGVDLVPVLEVPWPKEIKTPDLTPENSAKTIQLSNAADGSWRCSFAQIEAEVLGSLTPSERLPQLMGKILLSCLKAEPWMPRSRKSFCTWSTPREWKIVVANGFILKTAFLLWLEQHRLWMKEQCHFKKEQCREEEVSQRKKDPVMQLLARRDEDSARKLVGGQEKGPTKVLVAGQDDPGKILVAVFKNMCASSASPGESLVSKNISAYFGGQCEGPKSGDGAPLIVRCLEENLEN